MPTFGMTPDGFVPMTETDILARIEADQRSEISDTLDASDESLLGQLNRIYARKCAEAWHALDIVANSSDPQRATDALLTALAKLTGTVREGATFSTVVLSCALAAGTTLESGTHFAEVAGDPENRWTPVEDFTAPIDSTYQIAFRAENPGPVTAGAGTITVIATPVVGWSDPVTNPLPASPGKTADDDTALR